MWNKPVLLLLQLCSIVSELQAIERSELFPYGTLNGDQTLQEGDDETSKVMALTKPMRFFETSFTNLYVATNGIISLQDLPMEKQYVDDGFPTEFPVIAPFLADIDTSNGRGAIYYRQTESPGVLNRIADVVRRGFAGTQFTPTRAIITTWENVGAYEEATRHAESPARVNTFQAVVGYDEENTYALFLYPADGLHFFGARPKETFNVEIELPARVGFARGEVYNLFFLRTEGPHFSLTSNEQSVKNLYQTGNTGIPGVWLFHVGSVHPLENVVPAAAPGFVPTPRRPRKQEAFRATPEYPEGEYEPDEDAFDDEQEYNIDPDFQNPDAPEIPEHTGQDPPADLDEVTPRPEAPTHRPAPAGPDDRPETGRVYSEDIVQRQLPAPEHTLLEAYPVLPDAEVVSVDEDVDVQSGVIHYSTENKETCERFQQTCSQNAYCADYPSGYCCHCSPGFYGNGRHCLPDGAPQRVNGKVNGVVTVGSTPVGLDNIDLHAYIVVGDGRAYTAISEVPETLGRALMPATPIGGLFGWLFALRLPDSHNGFNVTGAEFIRHADVTFYPGNQRLSIVQTAKGLDGQNYLSVDTRLEGSVPFVPLGASVQMDPFSEIYHYYPSLITSSSVREFTVVSAESGAEKFTFQLRQNITYRDCRHAAQGVAETLQLNVERTFAMYVKEERVLRYAITNKIGHEGGHIPDPEQNPCYSGNHDCDTTAQCVPGEQQEFTCVCATGFTGDGRNCYDVDECAEGLSSCGSHSQCVNLPGSHSCQCQSGYEFVHDARTCTDIDECRTSPCHPHASCSNTQGSFHCTCQPGFHGDGFQCHHHHERPKSRCEHHRDSIQGGGDGAPVVGAFVPQCDDEGQYRPLQCHASTGHCWCVDGTGQERVGTRTPPGTPPTNCDAPEERPRTQCEQHRDGVQGGAGGVGAFVPQCDDEGQYRPLQCHGSTGHCWCVDTRGQERAGTRTPSGTPPTDCDAPERPRTQCEQHRDDVQGGAGGVGAFVPQCDDEGQYRPLQCHGSTGHCWCVDTRGQERVGTRTPSGTPPTDCDAPERPRTQCEQHRDGVRGGADGLPLVGAFVPQCDDDGQYRPLQCHGSTGHCWCVDTRGQERTGTRTPSGTPPTNCDAPVVPVPTQRPETVCERWHASLMEHYGGRPGPEHYLPQCDSSGEFTPVQCYGDTSYCWCVDKDGREIPGTRSHDVKPACVPSVAPPVVHPQPRPDVTPPPSGTSLLYAQGQQIGALPLDGTRMDKEKSKVLLALHGSIVVGIDYDCREKKVYWTDLAGRTISRAAMETGAEAEILISTGLVSPEGLAIDVTRRRMYWVDSTPDKIETARLDGSDRRVLFDTDLVNPRAIIVDSQSGTLYWTDWNREAPKIESSTVDGHNRRVLVRDGIGLPNALTFDPTTRRICWADAGTKRLECVDPDGSNRRQIHANLNYPFSMVLHSNHFYYTDWRRDGVISVSRDSSQFTDEYLPDQRSHLYGITVASSRCL
ncbi:nidogen-2 [Trichomycterus rosablanca]|uniref:nidogen-2 n=1 Tax=Trichomycterus rosablanca TaxID=2290929 RepID=UPI002F360B5D